MSDDIFARLAAPFPVTQVSWRIGPTNKKSRERQEGPNAQATKGQALAFIDARDVMDRLDEVVGPANWQCKYSHANGKTVCDIGINVIGGPKLTFVGEGAHPVLTECWVWKADGAGDTDMEAEKGALSDAFKRAAVRWGIGRYLYSLPAPWVEIDEYKRIAESEMGRLRALLEQVQNGTAMPAPTNGVATKSSAAAKRDGKYTEIQNAMRNARTLDELRSIADTHMDWIASTPEAWQDVLRGIYEDAVLTLRERTAA